MSDEYENDEYEQENSRATKAEVIKYIDYALNLMAANATRLEVTRALTKEFGISPQQAYKYYIRATDQLQDDLNDKIAVVRSKRIHALHKDIKEAYANYLSSEIEGIQVKWHEQYTKLKNQLDNYYPNALKHESEKEALKIEIHYTDTKTQNDLEDE